MRQKQSEGISFLALRSSISGGWTVAESYLLIGNYLPKFLELYKTEIAEMTHITFRATPKPIDAIVGFVIYFAILDCCCWLGALVCPFCWIKNGH